MTVTDFILIRHFDYCRYLIFIFYSYYKYQFVRGSWGTGYEGFLNDCRDGCRLCGQVQFGAGFRFHSVIPQHSHLCSLRPSVINLFLSLCD
jgi:hypothetical protein